MTVGDPGLGTSVGTVKRHRPAILGLAFNSLYISATAWAVDQGLDARASLGHCYNWIDKMSKVNVVSAEVSPQLRLELVASQLIEVGDIIVQSCEEEIQDHRTWRTLQLDESRHLRNEFLNFVDHSCSPNSLLDADNLALVAIRDISVGRPITFFYPGSEVELSQAFECHCGSKECFRHINGGFYLNHDQMRWAMDKGYCTMFMQRQFERLLRD